jgi:hypothetical protein
MNMLYTWFLVLGILYGVRGEFPHDVLGLTADPETSSRNLPRILQNH